MIDREGFYVYIEGKMRVLRSNVVASIALIVVDQTTAQLEFVNTHGPVYIV